VSNFSHQSSPDVARLLQEVQRDIARLNSSSMRVRRLPDFLWPFGSLASGQSRTEEVRADGVVPGRLVFVTTDTPVTAGVWLYGDIAGMGRVRVTCFNTSAVTVSHTGSRVRLAVEL
jgi:hypothetical protein